MGQRAANVRSGSERPFHGLTPFTLLDYPGRIAAVVWIAGCNMRCRYCHNPSVVLGPGQLDEASVLEFLDRRRGRLEGVVLSGGEATGWRGLCAFARKIKAMGYAVKLDTNGLRPPVVATMMADRLVDRVALDYKAPPERFRAVTATSGYRRFLQTLELLCGQREVPFDIRTTIHTALFAEEDVITIAAHLAALGYAGPLRIQQARSGPGHATLGKLDSPPRALDRQRLELECAVPLAFA